MPHVTHFILIMAFAVGVATVTVSAQMYRRYRLDFLRAHLAIVASFNLMIFMSIVALYIFNLPRGSVPRAALRVVDMAFQFLVPLLQILAAYFFLQIIYGLLERPFDRRIRSVMWCAVGAYAAVQTIALAASIAVGEVRLADIVSRIAWFLSIGVIYAVLLVTFPRIGRIDDHGRRRALRAYWILLLGLMTFIIALIALSATGVLTLAKYNLATGLLILVLNAIPVLYLRWFVERYHGGPAAVTKHAAAIGDAAFERYDISPREREVIRLICEGKTNREIANELFISVQTVKDHAYRIFRKTGVKNRVQLVSLFLTSSGETDPL
jgi:DNA-binding CsgD family transcriptional regulator